MPIRISLALFGLSCCALVAAQTPTYGELKARDPRPVPAAQLRDLLPGAHVVSRTSAGSVRNWTNGADGKFIASTDARGTSGVGRYQPSTAPGTWRIDDQGRYCVTIQWGRNPDDWCKTIVLAGGKYYGINRTEDSSTTMEFEFSK